MIGDWIELVIGACMIVAPWIFGFANVPFAKWTDMLAGAALVVMNLATMYGKRPAPDLAIVAEGTAAEIVEAVSLAPPEGAAHRPKRTRRTPARARNAGLSGSAEQ